MLPCSLEGTYKLYKNDTSVFVQWLWDNGTKCGYVPPNDKPTQKDNEKIPAKSHRSKGKGRAKARKALKPTATSPTVVRRVNLNELLPLANAIANSKKPTVKVPSRVVRAGLRAIALRKKCSAYFRANDTDEVEAQITDRHIYFISLMENVILALQHLFEANVNPTTSSVTQDSFIQLENRFAALDVEEPTQNESTSPTKATINVATTKVELQIAQNTEDNDDEEQQFAIYCLSEDLGRLKGYVAEAWDQYGRKELDLVTVSVITNTAFQLAMRTQEECLSGYPELLDHEVLIELVQAKYSKWKIPPESLYDIEMACLAAYCHDTSSSGLSPVLESSTSMQTHEASSFSSKDQGETESRMVAARKQVGNMEFLLDLFRKLVVIHGRGLNFHNIEDELTAGFYKMIETGRVEIWLSFAASCLVIISQSRDAFEDFQQIAKQVINALSKNLEYTKRFDFPQQYKALDDVAERFVQKVKDSFLEDLLFEPTKAARSNEKNGSEIPGLSERLYILKRQPILCGMLAFRILMDSHVYGLHMVNFWGSATYPGHLYNALRKQKFDFSVKRWTLMEELISLHTEGLFFLGAAPETLLDSMKQVCLMSGFSPRHFAPDGRRPAVGHIRTRNGRRRALETPFLLKKLFEHHKREAWVFYIEESLNKQAKEAEMEANPGNKLLRKAWATTRRLTPTQLLEALKSALPSELQKLRFDYCKFHQQSMGLIHSFVQSLEVQETAEWPADTLKNGVDIGFHVPYHLIWMELYAKPPPGLVRGIANRDTLIGRVNYEPLRRFAQYMNEYLERQDPEPNAAEAVDHS